MKDVDLKKLGTLRLCGGGALVVLTTWGIWAFCSGGFSASNGREAAFDGWEYGCEDQKTASAALAAAGLDEWSWEDGRLLVPKDKRSEYQAALAEAGAYPKAPGESRRVAIREMGAFESETKMRMRELDVYASQLERTLERIGGIEYATVGVRERREQAGLTTKTVVTASIGVSCRKDCQLDANLLSAITVAAKHQLGVAANENISILDLKTGNSFFGSERLVGNGNDLALTAEKERVESYWRDKLLKTFDYMGGVRVSVAAELVAVDPDDVARTEIENGWDDSNDLGDLGAEYRVDPSATRKVAKQERATSAAERLAQVEIGEKGEIEKPRPLPTWDGDAQKIARNGAFARLGNPVAIRNSAPVEAVNLARLERKTSENGVLLVGATARRDGRKSGVVPAGYRRGAENEENEQIERIAQAVKENAVKEGGASARLETVAQYEKKKEDGKNNEKKGNEKNRDEEKGNRRNGAERERVRFRVRSLAVRIGAPRGYVRRVAQNLKAESAVETFANDETTGNWSVVYRTTEQKIIDETKNVALVLLRPLAERNGWTENELARSVAVDVFADPNDFAERASDGRDAGERSNGPFEVVANFGQIADTSELIAEETTVDAPTSEEETETALETTEEEEEKKTETAFWALWTARARRLGEKSKAGLLACVGGGTILTLLTAGATAARRRKKKVGDVDEEENEERANETERTVAQNKQKRQSRQNKRKKTNDRKAREEENDKERRETQAAEETDVRQERKERASERNLRIARIEEKTATAQNAEIAQDDEETRNVRSAQFRRWISAARGDVDADSNERKTLERQGSFDDISGFGRFDGLDDLDDWDDLDDDLLEIRSLSERKRARVADETSENGEGNGDDATRRREALDLVARNPERAAASLRRWLRPGA